MAQIAVSWQTGTTKAPGGTVIDHVDVDLLNSDTSVAQSQPGDPGSGLPTESFFDNVIAGLYTVRARNFDQHGNQIGDDALTNEVEVRAPDIDVTILVSGNASVNP